MHIVPVVHHLESKDALFSITYQTKIVIEDGISQNGILYATILKESILIWAGVEVQILKGASKYGDIVLGLNQTLDEQEYTVHIDDKQVMIMGGTEAALLHGVQTFRQIVEQYAGEIPGVLIQDYPEMRNRGFYHDVSRGRVPTLSYLRQLVDKMSYYKLNQLQLYVEHTYLFREFSEVWRDETPLTAEEILELDRYCVARHIELIPSMSSFGHLYQLLRTKTYAEFCELPDSNKEPFTFWGRMSHHTIDVSNEESIELIKTMITEYKSLFTSKHFNICADETFDLGKGRSKDLAEQYGLAFIYIQFVKGLCEFLVDEGLTPMFWGDIICGFPDMLSELPKETICLNWGYDADHPEDSTKALHDAGAIQYLCPGVSGWNQFVNPLHFSYMNIVKMCSYARKYKAVGILNTDWGDCGHINHPDLSVPGMIYGAQFSWNSKEVPFEEINQMISEIEYKDHTGKLLSLIAKIEGTDIVSWYHITKYMEMQLENHPEEAREKLICDIDMNQALVKNLELSEIAREIRACARTLDSKKRGFLEPLLIGIDGIQLWNDVGAVIAKLGYQVSVKNTKDAKVLAKDLEVWFMHFKRVWRRTSKEGDLNLLSKLVFWYCDLLREYEN